MYSIRYNSVGMYSVYDIVGYLPKASSDVDVCSKGAVLHQSAFSTFFCVKNMKFCLWCFTEFPQLMFILLLQCCVPLVGIFGLRSSPDM